MKNIFSQTKDYVKPPKRNVFDLSFHNHGTYNFGTLYPVFCKEVIPGDSFKIDSSFALRFMPTAFPVQTRINANLHFFYVRNRNLWDDWQKFITHTGQTNVFPYLDVINNSITTGSLSDYLGVPSTISGNFGSYIGSDEIWQENGDAFYISNSIISVGNELQFSNNPNTWVSVSCMVNYKAFNSLRVNVVGDPRSFSHDFILAFVDGNNKILFTAYPEALYDSKDGNTTITLNFFGCKVYTSATDYKIFNSPQDFSDFVLSHYGVTNSVDNLTYIYLIQQSSRNPMIPNTQSPPILNRNISSLALANLDGPVLDLSSLGNSSNPFYSNNPNNIRLNALPYRAYESIYNAFYRNEQNDPLFIDGIPEYNKYVPNTDGGPDSFKYQLHQRNWELDFLTSSVQSPQQGIAPLVGVSSSGDFTFVNKDSNGNIGYFTAKANIGSDGSSITGFQLSDKVVLDGVPSDPASASEVPDNIKRGTVYSLNQMALAGISINDFRNVNALQRWLETNIRRGYKYQDQIKSHFGVDVDYKTLDMPEFIGGVSAPVFSSQVNQTTETETDPLGSYAGQLSLMTSSKHSVKHYCDEHGFIIGIFSVTPVPNYSQLLPKHFLKSNYLDYYFPEFGHIGMQPIDYREVCPIQAYSDDPNNLSKTFGYQRPWYDYIASVDEVHGLFRTNLRNFVLNRTFETMPKLNSDFLKVDADQLNDIFTVQDLEDKIIGQIYFDVTAKRPIPKYGIPRLE